MGEILRTGILSGEVLKGLCYGTSSNIPEESMVAS